MASPKPQSSRAPAEHGLLSGTPVPRKIAVPPQVSQPGAGGTQGGLDDFDQTAGAHGVQPGHCVLTRFHLHPLLKLLSSFAQQIERKVHLQVAVPLQVTESLDWWLTLGRLAHGLSLELPTRDVLTTDVSLLGWGAHLEEKVDSGIQGTWSEVEAVQSINWLELRAVRLALLLFQDKLHGSHCWNGQTT